MGRFTLFALLFFTSGHAYAEAIAGGKPIPFRRVHERENLDLSSLLAQKKALVSLLPKLEKAWKSEFILRTSFLGNILHDLCEYEESEQLFLRARTYYLSVRQMSNAAIISSNLGRLCQDQGEYLRSQMFFEEALSLLGDAKMTTTYGETLGDYAALAVELGDYQKAESFYRQCLKIFHPISDGKSAYLAVTHHNFGILHEKQGRFEQAITELNISRTLFEGLEKTHSFGLANVEESLAFLNTQLMQYGEAEPLFNQALSRYVKLIGKNHPAYARTLNNQGYMWTFKGDLIKAEAALTEALALRRKIFLLKDNMEVADSLTDLARLYALKKDPEGAWKAIDEALSITERNLNFASRMMSERQQLAMRQAFHARLDVLVALTLRGDVSTAKAYKRVLPWKGSAFSCQWEIRQARDNPEIAEDLRKSQRLAQRLAALDHSPPTLDPTVQTLAEEYEKLQGKLAFAGRGLQEFTTDWIELQDRLPAHSAFVDFYFCQNPGLGSAKASPPRFVAFVLDPECESPGLIDLGPASVLTAAIEAWRKAIIERAPLADVDKAGRDVRRLLWLPLEAAIGKQTHVLVAPDGAIGFVPFAAIPGSEPNSFLLEKYTFSVLPIPQFLINLLSPPKSGDTRLLTVGVVDYDAEPGKSATPKWVDPATRVRAATSSKWTELPATRQEILAVADSFKEKFEEAPVKELRKKEATEANVRMWMEKSRYVHFATHGFFAQPPVGEGNRSGTGTMNARGLHPGLLTGLVFAGANRPLAVDQDDGILTALEIADLDLRKVELAVLSACETGLGTVANGEGVLGLQRAFQVAGAKSVVSSLWSVSDDATSKLMAKFCENLWQEKMPRAQALRHAQLWMLKESGFRSVKRVDLKGEESTVAPPYFWAAFVLSGNWK